jgi:hypothetical protein
MSKLDLLDEFNGVGLIGGEPHYGLSDMKEIRVSSTDIDDFSESVPVKLFSEFGRLDVAKSLTDNFVNVFSLLTSNIKK